MREILKRRFHDSTSAITWGMIAVVCASLALFAFKAQAQESLSLGTVYHPPLMGTDESVLNKMSKAAFAAENIKVHFDIYPMARIKWALDENKSHAVIGSLNWFTERKQSSNFISVNLYQATLHLFYLKDRFPNGINFTQLSDLKKYRVGYVYGGVLEAKLKQAGVVPHLTKDSELNIKKLFRNRIDVVVVTKFSGWAMVRKNYPKDLERFAIDDHVLYRANLDLLFAPSESALAKTFEQGLHKIKSSGEYDEILATYLPTGSGQ